MTDSLLSSSSPWQDKSAGKVIWCKSATLTDYDPCIITWALHPLWIDNLGDKEFPYCALQPLPHSFRRWLGKDYILSDTKDPGIASVTVTQAGLEKANNRLPWDEIKHLWPAIVSSANAICYSKHSALHAMTVWIRKEKPGEFMPFYVPGNANWQTLKVNEENVILWQELAIDYINLKYLTAIERSRKKHLLIRKARKLFNHPTRFFYDSKLYRLIEEKNRK